MATDKKFTDFDIDFEKNTFTNDVSLKTDRNAIRQSIMNIILTNPGEKPFDSSFGTGLYNFLFENITNDVELERMEMDIKNEILAREPRAEVETVVWDDSNIDNNELTVEINYTVFQGARAEPIMDSLRIELTKVR